MATFRNITDNAYRSGIGPSGSRFRNLASRVVLGAQSYASLTTALSGSNNDLVFTAHERGTAGNSTTIRYVVAGNSTALSVAVSGTDITVNVATDSGGAATSTASQVKAAVDARAAAAALVTVALATGNDGSGVVAALSRTSLAGGLGYRIGS